MTVMAEDNLREITPAGVSLSSFKPSFGLQQLLNPSPDAYWQSDGMQPHSLLFSLQRLQTISQLSIFLDYAQDESYTPRTVAIKAGLSMSALIEIARVELDEPQGWTHIRLPDVRAFFVQLVVLSNHQSGKDTHIRLVKLYSPIQH